MEKSQGACSLPPKESSLFKRIVKYYDQKQYKTGLKFANQILSNPKFAEHGETLSMKGILLNCMGKKEEARDLVKRGLRANLQSFVLLQMHTRDLEGCKETRTKLLTQRPSQKASWVGYAVIQHFLGNLDAAANVVNEFLKVQTGIEPYNYEHSELLLYYVTILIESERFDEALSFMESCTKDVVDHVTYLETHADLLFKLGRGKEAEKDVWDLLERNPENKLYYELLYRIDAPELAHQHIDVSVRLKKALDIVSTELEVNPTIVDLYVLKAEIYRDAGDVVTASRWMEEAQSLDTADRFINALCTKYMVQAQRLEDAEAMASKFTRGSSTAAAYLSEMQCMWFLIENALALRTMKKYGEALKLCHEIDRHYSTVLEDQLDFHSYCLRKGTLRAYVETVRLEDRLRDHPAYFNAAALAIEIYLFLHLNPLGEETETVDQPGSNMPTSELKKLRNKQRRAERRAEAEAQRSKADQERREQGQRSRQNADREAEADKPPEVEELDSKKLARPEDALSEAARFLQPLVELSNSRIETHCLAYEIYERKEKWLLMLRSIRRGLALPGAVDHPWFNECTVRFLHRLTQLPKPTDEGDALVNEVLLEEVRSVFSVPTKSPLPDALKYNEEFIRRNSKSFIHVFRGTLAKAIVDPESAALHLKQLPSPSAEDLGEIKWDVLHQALELLKRQAALRMIPITDDLIEEFRAACAKRFPLAAVFLPLSEWEELRKSAIEAAYESALYGAYPQSIAAGDAERSTIVENELAPGLKVVSLTEQPVVNGSSGGAVVDSPPLNNTQQCKAKSGKRKKGMTNKGKDPASVAAV
ncbi:N-alpha-acetyltransferase 15, NatA auxiliary subunit [Sparganum proliferum]